MAGEIIIIGLGIMIFIFLLSNFRNRGDNLPRRMPSANRRAKTHRRSPPPRRQQIRSVNRSSEPDPNLMLQQGRTDDAINLYTNRGQYFLAAQVIAAGGPQDALRTTDYIRRYSPDRFDLMVTNLVEDFYSKKNQPAIAAALYRASGRIGEAEAIEITSNIPSTARFVNFEVTKPEVKIERTLEVQANSTPTPVSEQISQETTVVLPEKSNKLMLAAQDLGANCLVCKRGIESGQTYLFCLNCGKVGHSKHLLEYSKVRGECPNCNERIAYSMYDLE